MWPAHTEVAFVWTNLSICLLCWTEELGITMKIKIRDGICRKKKKKKREFVQLPAQAGCVCTCICCLFVCTAVFAFLCVLACAARYSFIEPFCFVYYMPRCVCIHYLHAHSAGSQYELLCVRVCVYWMRMAPHPDGPLLGKERGGGSLGGRIKRNGSNPLKLMTVCLSEWIYLSQMPQKLALKWFWWQTSPWISPMADTQMFMFTELERGVQKGTLVWGRVMGRESICGVGR